MKKTTFLIKIICISLLTNLLVLPVSAQAPASLQNDTEAVDVGSLKIRKVADKQSAAFLL